MKKKYSSILLIIVFFIGLSILLYPSVSNYINSKNQSQLIANYDNTIHHMNNNDFDKILNNADEYNKKIFETKDTFSKKKISGYNETLRVENTDIMGYISIDKINVRIPIYHGSDEGVLQVGAGHIEGTSLPIGGVNTHSVLSAHRGLPSAKLFTDLDQLEIGDTFTITVLNQLLTYEVDQILIVKPNEISQLELVEGKDYVTLVTCTPYAINTHRLLVRGVRIENNKNQINVNANAMLIDPILIVPLIATPILFILLIVLLLKYRKKD